MNRPLRLSLIICTFAPEEPIFRRCLQAVSKLKLPEGVVVEGIIVDNNSPTPVETMAYVNEVLSTCHWLRLIREPKPGLTHARLAGYAASTAPWLIYFDDDNEPDAGYLEGLMELVTTHPRVGIWGPGWIDVEYIGTANNWYQANKWMFQERKFAKEEFEFTKGWHKSSPPGTGQSLRRDVMEAYAQKVASGELTSKDRTGKSLVSAGDVQIVYTAIKMGFAAGVSPKLHVNHLISSRKTTLRYLKRHAYGTSSSYIKAHLELFPEDRHQFYGPQVQEIYKKLKQLGIDYVKGTRAKYDIMLDAGKLLGKTASLYELFSIKEPLLIRTIISVLKLR